MVWEHRDDNDDDDDDDDDDWPFNQDDVLSRHLQW